MSTETVRWVLIPVASRTVAGTLPLGTTIAEIPAGSDQDKILSNGGTIDLDGKSYRPLDTRCRYEISSNGKEY